MELNYIKHKIANLISINKIVTIHYYEFDSEFMFEGESHNFWEMVYVDSGEVEICANEKIFHLRQGDIIFHKPNEFHTIKSHNEPANVFVISFVCSSKYMSFFEGKRMVVPSKMRRNIGEIIEEYNQTFYPMSQSDTFLRIRENPPIGGQQMIRTHLEQFLIMLVRNETESNKNRLFPSKESMENHIISQIAEMIDENMYSKFSVDDICQSMSYSRAYISKLFKVTTGYTPLEYILKKKIGEAKRLIREDKLNFTQISDVLCFDNPHYFSTVFKRVTNMTPSEYKNSVKST